MDDTLFPQTGYGVTSKPEMNRGPWDFLGRFLEPRLTTTDNLFTLPPCQRILSPPPPPPGPYTATAGAYRMCPNSQPAAVQLQGQRLSEGRAYAVAAAAGLSRPPNLQRLGVVRPAAPTLADSEALMHLVGQYEKAVLDREGVHGGGHSISGASGTSCAQVAARSAKRAGVRISEGGLLRGVLADGARGVEEHRDLVPTVERLEALASATLAAAVGAVFASTTGEVPSGDMRGKAPRPVGRAPARTARGWHVR